jgi:transposase
MKKNLRDEFVKLIEEGKTITGACKALGVHRSTYYDWLKESKEFALNMSKARRASISSMNEIAEVQVRRALIEGDNRMVRWWMESQHPLFVRNRNTVTIISRGENSTKEESEVDTLSKDNAFSMIKAMYLNGFKDHIKIPKNLEREYAEWVEENKAQERKRSVRDDFDPFIDEVF